MKLNKYSKKVVTGCILMVLGYTVATLVIFYLTGREPTELTRFFFGFITVELWSLAGIKKREIKENIDLSQTSTNNEDMRGE